jgi:D-3-phosphoglycerate dehydrogenase
MLYSATGDLESWTKHQRALLGRRTVLVIGMGNIGSRVCAKLGSMVNLLCYDVATHAGENLETMLPRAEVVSLHIPLTDSTRGWFDREKLALMRDGAALVNTARAQLVDENALFREVQSGRLRAAFDVFWTEPYHGPLRAYHPGRFLMTPHIASTCEDFLTGLAEDLRAFAASLEKV